MKAVYEGVAIVFGIDAAISTAIVAERYNGR
jgi:hypothetical protein